MARTLPRRHRARRRRAARRALARPAVGVVRVARCRDSPPRSIPQPRLAGGGVDAGHRRAGARDRVSLGARRARRRHERGILSRPARRRADRALGCRAARAALLVRGTRRPPPTRRLAAGGPRGRMQRGGYAGVLSLETRLRAGGLARDGAIGRSARPGIRHVDTLRPCGSDGLPPAGTRPWPCRGPGRAARFAHRATCRRGRFRHVRTQHRVRRGRGGLLGAADRCRAVVHGRPRAGQSRGSRRHRGPASAHPRAVCERPRPRPRLLAGIQRRLLRRPARITRRSGPHSGLVTATPARPATARESSLSTALRRQDLHRSSRTATGDPPVSDSARHPRDRPRTLPQATPHALRRVRSGRRSRSGNPPSFSTGRQHYRR